MSQQHKLHTVETRVILGLILISLLNIVIFRSLSAHDPLFLLLNDSAIFLYAICIFSMIGLTILKKPKELKYAFYILLSLMAANIVFNLLDLIANKRISDNGSIILADAFIIWVSSVGVFAFWHWIIDRGGPIERALESKGTRADLLFPQYQSQIPGWEHWQPQFWDYFVFSFFTSTGFSPADTLPLTLRAKILMMMEAAISLVIIGMVASRAISLIQ